MTFPILIQDKWYNAIYQRRSRRQFNGRVLSSQVVEGLKNFSQKLNASIDGARTIVITENPEKVFKGAIGSYGKIKHAPAYLAFIGNMNDPNVQEKVGYSGEFMVLEATSMGLGTCWVGGFFNPDIVKAQVQLNKNERILAVSPVGFVEERYTLEEKIMSGFAKTHKRKNLEELVLSEPPEPPPPWVNSALEAARLAPSAVNRQPWRFSVTKDTIKVSLDNPKESFHVSKRLDCGIAMAHIEVGAKYTGFTGKWEYLQGIDVARFKVE